jgi:hypothetical protein
MLLTNVATEPGRETCLMHARRLGLRSPADHFVSPSVSAYWTVNEPYMPSSACGLPPVFSPTGMKQA